MRTDITTYGEAAVLFEVRPTTLGELAGRLGIKPKRVPRNGNAKGLDAADIKRLSKVLGPPRDRAAS